MQVTVNKLADIHNRILAQREKLDVSFDLDQLEINIADVLNGHRLQFGASFLALIEDPPRLLITAPNQIARAGYQALLYSAYLTTSFCTAINLFSWRGSV